MKAIKPQRDARVKAFTLIELLTVIAITAVLMTLIIVPVVQSFNLTRAAQGFSEAQERGRIVIDRIARELTNGASARDNTGLKGAIGLVLPGQNGQPVEIVSQYMKLDVVKPAEGEPPATPGQFVNPNTGRVDPTLVVPKGQVVLPAAPGASFVRYFVGLADPVDGNPGAYVPKGYNNPYDDLLMNRNSQQDNLYVLYRVEYQPFVWDGNVGRFVVNTQLFTDQNNDNFPDDFDDPFFFSFRPASAGANADLDAGGNLITGDPVRGQAKARRIANWMRRAVILTDVHRYDMIMPIFHKGTRQVTYVNNVPQIIPLVQFRPTRMTSEPAAALAAVRQGDEAEGMDLFAPDVYQTKFGAWVNTFVRAWPNGYDQTAGGTQNDYLIGKIDPADGDFKVFSLDPDTQNELNGGTPVFNVSLYQRLIQQGAAFPFSNALVAGNLTNQDIRNLFVAFHHEPRSGRIFTGFAITEVNHQTTQPSNPENEPQVETGEEIAPVSDPNTSGNFYDPAFESINKRFNWTWNNQPGLRPNIHRYIDLRVTPRFSEARGPLHPDPSIGFPRAKIVPNSEVVIGPDQNPGPNYRNPVRYTRTTRTPGPNQYRINYVNLAEPDYSLLGLPTPPATYDPQNFMSAVYQPRFKAGYIQLNSDPNVPLPGDDPATVGVNEGVIRVFYKFQMTHPRDVFAVDYDTRQLISVLLTVRNYPQTSLPNPQTITLRANAKVRNFLR